MRRAALRTYPGLIYASDVFSFLARIVIACDLFPRGFSICVRVPSLNKKKTCALRIEFQLKFG